MSESINLKFSGHDTFHCKEQWLLKGYQQVSNQLHSIEITSSDSIVELGVGKNMVRAISHWLKAFGLINHENQLTDFAHDIFNDDGFDPYLEDQGSLWLLQHQLCKLEYASIYKLVFIDYFYDKATLEFSESQVINFLRRKLIELEEKAITENTLGSDLKVLLKTYLMPSKVEKTLEDDFNAPLQVLNLIINSGRKSENGERVYVINKKNKQRDLSLEIFGYCLLSEFPETELVSYDEIKMTLGSYLCLTNEGLLDLITELCNTHSQFIFKEDSVIRQLQFNTHHRGEFMKELLKKHYNEKK